VLKILERSGPRKNCNLIEYILRGLLEVKLNSPKDENRANSSY
jgi:hypothetical protein